MPGKKESEELRREQIIQAAFRVAVRTGLEQLTIRLVAAEAGLSTGLVFFHFESKETLLLALLDWLLDSLFEYWETPDDVSPTEGLLILLQTDLQDTQLSDLQDMEQSAQAGTRLQLFFAYWAMAVHHPLISERIRHAIERSWQTFLPAVQALINSNPQRFQQVTPEGLVTVMLAIAQGCAMQSLLSTPRVDVEQILAAVRALLISY
jgi:AcrR family transcriptional regulator